MLNYLPDNLSIYVSYIDSIPQSSLICFFNKVCEYSAYNGRICATLGANHLLFWEAIKYAKQKGIKYFDFIGARINPIPGSKQEEIQKFKKHFGEELIKGFLWKMPINKFKYSFYNFLIRIEYLFKLKKFIGDIIDQELNAKNIFSKSEFRTPFSSGRF